MRDEDGKKTPLGWIVAIAIALIIAGVAFAMLFVDNEEVSNMIKQYLNKNNTVQTETK